MGPVQRRPRILVPVAINGKPFWAVLDSGAALTQLDVTTAAEVGVTPDTPGVTVAGTTSGLRSSEAITWLGAFESFVIGDESVARPNLLFGDLGLRRSLLLGADFLLKHRVLIAHSQRKVYFSHVGAANAAGGERSSGAATDAAPKGVHDAERDR
jgi:predicted aspartyl protease